MLMLKKKLLAVLFVGESQATFAQGSGSKLDFLASLGTDWPNEQKARETLLAVIPLIRRRQISELCVVLPRTMFFSKLIHLPSVDEQEIRKMVALQIGQLLPYAQEQAVWDCVVCGQKDFISDVMILSAQREAVMRYLRIFSSAGLFPTVVTVSSYALAGLATLVDSRGHKVLLFIDEHSAEICFCLEGKFYFSRGMMFGTKDFSKGKIADFWAQVRLTFVTQRQSFPQYAAPTGLYLTRFANDLPMEFLEQLVKESGVAWTDVSADDCQKKMGAFSLPNQQSVDMNVLMILTILSQDFKNLCNFLPKDFKERHNKQARRKNAIWLIFLALSSVFFVTLAVGAPVVKKVQQWHLLNAELERMENPFHELRKEKELWTAVDHRLQKRIVPLFLVEELYRVASNDISFTRIYFNSQNEVQLEGQALQSSAVNDLQERMISGDVLRDVRLEHTVRRISSAGEVVQFVILAKVQSIAQLKGK